jgi:hypothetical protein
VREDKTRQRQDKTTRQQQRAKSKNVLKKCPGKNMAAKRELKSARFWHFSDTSINRLEPSVEIGDRYEKNLMFSGSFGT